MISPSNSTKQPDTVLQPQTIARLLESLQAGVIDMAYFRDLFHSDNTLHWDYSQATPEMMERVEHLCQKVRFTTDGQVPLTRALKIRLLQSIRSGRINLAQDYPELMAARKAVQYDWSSLTPQDIEFLSDTAIALTA